MSARWLGRKLGRVGEGLQLGPCQTDSAKVFEQGDLGVDVVKHDACAVKVEADGVVEVSA